MNENLVMLHKINKLNNIYEYLMSSLSDTEEHNKLLENLLGIIEDLEHEFEEKLIK